jgi:hypothetical protein
VHEQTGWGVARPGTKKGDRNRLKIVLDGKKGPFYVNGHFVANFDASDVFDSGDVTLNISPRLLRGDGERFEVEFEDFRVSELR